MISIKLSKIKIFIQKMKIHFNLRTILLIIGLKGLKMNKKKSLRKDKKKKKKKNKKKIVFKIIK